MSGGGDDDGWRGSRRGSARSRSRERERKDEDDWDEPRRRGSYRRRNELDTQEERDGGISRKKSFRADREREDARKVAVGDGKRRGGDEIARKDSTKREDKFKTKNLFRDERRQEDGVKRKDLLTDERWPLDGTKRKDLITDDRWRDNEIKKEDRCKERSPEKEESSRYTLTPIKHLDKLCEAGCTRHSPLLHKIQRLNIKVNWLKGKVDAMGSRSWE
ncbi:hypothetical protein HK101_006808 [Irineochytrium annulatum]|nr:hypothetical protein HK101_006808 [Irineochytrium annulatum]